MDNMSDLVANFIMREVCKNQGSLQYSQLCQLVSPIPAISGEMLYGVLTKKSRFIIVDGKDETDTNHSLRPDSVVIAKTALRVCQSVPGNCDSCADLHLCRYFVCGSCRYRDKCKNCHDLDSENNLAALKREGLQNLEQEELFFLLLQNDSYLLPEVCVHYNRGSGQHGACQFKGNCINLHICMQFLLGLCQSETCSRAHKFHLKATKILSGRGLSAENTSNLHKIYRNRLLIISSENNPKKQLGFLSKNPGPVRKMDKNTICLFFLRKKCIYEEKCNCVHSRLPYKWQMLVQEDSGWTDLPNTEEIEKDYCNPEKSTSMGPFIVDFCSMTCGSAKVRRLSTVSSVTKPADFILTTNWLWYWKNDQGQWIQYQHEANGSTPWGQRYVVRFEGMYELSIERSTKCEVRRRPRFVSTQEVKELLERGTERTTSSSAGRGVREAD
ncbi:hypothetical protein GJAV_G00165630 [Gymnothorax javanicus]|nr:hypothetical protein GJAV_G00165630 [Gymnothorax javanicus]